MGRRGIGARWFRADALEAIGAMNPAEAHALATKYSSRPERLGTVAKGILRAIRPGSVGRGPMRCSIGTSNMTL